MSSQRRRVALVGAGQIANRHANVFAAMADEVEVCGIADLQPAAARAMARRFGCAAFGACAELLDGCRPDAIVIATPPAVHAADMWRASSAACMCSAKSR